MKTEIKVLYYLNNISTNISFWLFVHFSVSNGLGSDPLGGLQGGPAQCKIYNTRAELKGGDEYNCIPLAIKPVTYVCLFPLDTDSHVSFALARDGIWEAHIVKYFQKLLLEDIDLGVYDIGANIGVYSMLAATMGHKVVAVEPYLPSLKRLHKAIKLGKLEDKVLGQNVQTCVNANIIMCILFLSKFICGGIEYQVAIWEFAWVSMRGWVCMHEWKCTGAGWVCNEWVCMSEYAMGEYYAWVSMHGWICNEWIWNGWVCNGWVCKTLCMRAIFFTSYWLLRSFNNEVRITMIEAYLLLWAK